MGYNELIKIAISDFKEQLNVKNQTLVEVGRFILDKSERNRRLYYIYIQLAYAYFPQSYHFYLHCLARHTSGYKIMGGELFPSTAPFSKYDLDWNVHHFNRTKIAPSIINRTDVMSAAFAQYKHIIYDANQPQSFFCRASEDQLVHIL